VKGSVSRGVGVWQVLLLRGGGVLRCFLDNEIEAETSLSSSWMMSIATIVVIRPVFEAFFARLITPNPRLG